MELRGKRIAILIDTAYQEMEVWYPYYRFQEAGRESDRVQANDRASSDCSGLSGWQTGQRGRPYLPHASQHRHQVAATFRATRLGWVMRRTATWRQARLWRGFPQPGIGSVGTAATCGPSLLGRSGGSLRAEKFGPCRSEERRGGKERRS